MVIGKESIALARQVLKNSFLWTVVALVLLFTIYYYAADITDLDWLAPQGYLGITRQAFQRALFLIPVFVAAWKLGLKGGVACTIIVGAIMVPRAMAGLWRTDSIVETAVIVIIGIISTRLVSSLVEARNLQQSIADDLKKTNERLELEIAGRRRAEERLRQAAEEWRTTFDSIADSVSLQDRHFRIVRLNKAYADTFKKHPRELVGKTCYELIHGTSEPIPDCPHRKTLETREPNTAEFFEPHLGVYLEVSTSPIFNEQGEVVASVHITRDITERKHMEEQLLIADRLASIGELSAGIAHEVNNPLTSVIGFAQLLLEEDIPDNLRGNVEIISREAERASGIVKNLLTFSRRHDEVKQMVNINTIIEKVLELRAYQQKVNNIEVNLSFADIPEVVADYFQLQQVFLNIIVNAEYFMAEVHQGGTLSIATKKTGDIIRVTFTDDGPGIAREDLGHLFDPFFTTKGVGKGTGLGLSICHGIVTGHGGRIYAESALGQGTTFVVELPLRCTDEEAILVEKQEC